MKPMLIPAVFLYLVISAILITVAGLKRNITVLAVLALLLWISSLLSAFFVGWAWLERSYSENWALYGVLFLSLPVIVSNCVLAVAGLIVASVRGIERRKRVCQSLYLLLLFLAVQVVMGIWAA
jgi:hypothetical protein